MPTSRQTGHAWVGYVLHRYDWSESSLILDIFTREQGRLTVVAKGAKRPYSQLRSVLLPFQRIHVTLGRVPKPQASEEPSQGDIRTLRSAEWAGGSAMLSGPALFSGFYLNELLMKLLGRQDPHPPLFDVYAQVLPCLARGDEAGTQAALRAFELTLLKEVGVLPDLSQITATLEPVQPHRRYGLSPELGILASAGGGEIDGQGLIQLQAALVHGSFDALRQACTPVLQELRPMLRAWLHYHLGTPMLRTRQVMLDVQAMER